MSKDDAPRVQPVPGEGTGAKGGKDVLKADQQEPLGVEPDSEVDAKLREKQGHGLSGLNPNTIVRNG